MRSALAADAVQAIRSFTGPACGPRVVFGGGLRGWQAIYSHVKDIGEWHIWYRSEENMKRNMKFKYERCLDIDLKT